MWKAPPGCRDAGAGAAAATSPALFRTARSAKGSRRRLTTHSSAPARCSAANAASAASAAPAAGALRRAIMPLAR